MCDPNIETIVGPWHWWRAWYPVRCSYIDGRGWTWFERIERREIIVKFSYATDADLNNHTVIFREYQHYPDFSSLFARTPSTAPDAGGKL